MVAMMKKLIFGCGLAIAAGLAACSESTAPSAPVGKKEKPAAVNLSAEQLNTVKIAPAKSRSFPIEKTAVGSISFDEDPAVTQAESTLVGAAATFDLTSKVLARVQGLGTSNGISQKELEQAISDQQTAQAALKAARDALRAQGKSDVEIDRMIATGRIPLPSMSSSAGKWGLINIAESDSVSIHVGQPVSLKVLAYPEQVFHGKVSKVYATVDPATHRVAVRAQIADPLNELRAGMLADFSIRIRDAAGSPAVPANGVVREADGTSTVWVTTDRRRFVPHTVKTGQRRDDWVQIVAGLQPGDLVVTDGAVFLSNLLQAPPSD